MRLFPQRWRDRYGDEFIAVVEQTGLSPLVVVDVLRTAIHAQLHPELAPTMAVAGGGSTTLAREWRRVRTGVLGAVLAVLVVACGYALAQPLPPIPIILPIGSHASPETVALSRGSGFVSFDRNGAPADPMTLRVTARTDCCAAVVLANGSATHLVTSYRTWSGGWWGGGGGLSRFAPQSTDPITVSVSSAWSSGAVPGDVPWAWVAVEGLAASPVARVEVLFADGNRKEATLANGAYVWFDALRAAPAPEREVPDRRRLTVGVGPAVPAEQVERLFGTRPTEVIAYDASGRELARVKVSTPR